MDFAGLAVFFLGGEGEGDEIVGDIPRLI